MRVTSWQCRWQLKNSNFFLISFQFYNLTDRERTRLLGCIFQSVHANCDEYFHRKSRCCRLLSHSSVSTTNSCVGHHRDLVPRRYLMQNCDLFPGKVKFHPLTFELSSKIKKSHALLNCLPSVFFAYTSNFLTVYKFGSCLYVWWMFSKSLDEILC